MTQEIKSIVDGIATAFDEYKKTNDARIDAVKAGQGTAELEAKLARMDAALDEAKTKQTALEAKLNRPGVFAGDKQDGEIKEAAEYRHAFTEWMRAPTDHERHQKAALAQ
jgi:hypothetical protein